MLSFLFIESDAAPRDAEIRAFKILHHELSSPDSLMHFSSDRHLYIDPDVSKQRGFVTTIHRVVNNSDGECFSSRDTAKNVPE